jgi:UDP-N-acetylglucosamine 2-epimerase (non-hydrolysing)
MKIMTVLGTRPEIIRLSRVIARLDELCEHIVVHTGQNFDPHLRDVFFRELRVRRPNHVLTAQGSFGQQLATLLPSVESLLIQEQPDRLLILGDTNSGLAAIIAKRLGIAVFHMEAGNRCFDDRVPEEVNRRIIDHACDVWLPYTERSRQNLLAEGIPSHRIFVTGNPILEVIRSCEADISKSDILGRLGLSPQRYFLTTMHRAENVDVEAHLLGITTALDQLARQYQVPVIVSTHPRTRQRMEAYRIERPNPLVRFLEPFGFFDFITLERQAMCVLSDSGTVQEECTIFQVPSVTLRQTTERPETLERGCNILSGTEPASIQRCVRKMLERKAPGTAPPEYLVDNVSETVTNLLTGFATFVHTQSGSKGSSATQAA